MVALDEVVERPRRHLMDDGVVELALGLLFFLTGAIWGFGRTLTRGSTFADVYTIAAPCLCGVVWVASIWGMKKLKERAIVPRAGYVSLHESVRVIRHTSTGLRINFSSKALPLAVVVFVGFWGWLEASQRLWIRDPNRWGWIIGLSLAGWLAVCLVWTALQFKAPRYLWLAALSLAVGWWTYGRSSDPNLDLMAMLTWLGAGSVLMGSLRLRTFLKANPISRGVDAEN